MEKIQQQKKRINIYKYYIKDVSTMSFGITLTLFCGAILSLGPNYPSWFSAILFLFTNIFAFMTILVCIEGLKIEAKSEYIKK